MFDIVVDILVDCTKIVIPLIGFRIIGDTIRTFIFQK